MSTTAKQNIKAVLREGHCTSTINGLIVIVLKTQFCIILVRAFLFFFQKQLKRLKGGKNSINCTLILTEGDSAKTLAVAGLSVVGRERYGVFPLCGKLLNVREASQKQVNICMYHNKVYCFKFVIIHTIKKPLIVGAIPWIIKNSEISRWGFQDKLAIACMAVVVLVLC